MEPSAVSRATAQSTSPRAPVAGASPKAGGRSPWVEAAWGIGLAWALVLWHLTVVKGMAPAGKGWLDVLMAPANLLALVLVLGFSYLGLDSARRRARETREIGSLVQLLKEASQREAQANQLKTVFLASISHDLRTPLNSILGFSELIRKDAKDAATARFSGLIHYSGKYLLELADTLLDLSRIEAGRVELHWERIDLRAVLSSLTQIHTVSAEEKQLKLSLTMPSSPLIIETDRTRLMRVLNNILNNAIKFTTSGGVWVSATRYNDFVRIRVVDTGMGIPKERVAQVFDRFSLLASEPGPEHGVGLGMALSRELVEMMGGGMHIVSEPWVGTEVEVRLPLRQRTDSEAAAEPAPAPATSEAEDQESTLGELQQHEAA